MIYLAGVLGLRLSEVIGLLVGQIDPGARTVEIAETIAEVGGRPVAADVKSPASRRTLRMPGFVADMLGEHPSREKKLKTPEALVFEAPDGGPLRATNFRNRVFRPAAEQARLAGVTSTVSVTPLWASWSPSAPTSRPSNSGWGTRRFGSRATSTGRCCPRSTSP